MKIVDSNFFKRMMTEKNLQFHTAIEDVANSLGYWKRWQYEKYWIIKDVRGNYSVWMKQNNNINLNIASSPLQLMTFVKILDV